MTQDTEEVRQKKNITDFLLGIGVALLLYISVSVGWHQYQGLVDHFPATNWVEVTRFNIPDFEAGADPIIDYQRTIKQEVSSSWTAELRRYEGDGEGYSVVCIRNGFSELDPFRVPPPSGWSMASFVGSDCVSTLNPGVHRLSVTWELRPIGVDDPVFYPFSSNAFTILG